MNFIKRILFGIEDNSSFKIKYSKDYKSWYVVRDQSIVYIGQKDKCELYLANFNNQ